MSRFAKAMYILLYGVYIRENARGLVQPTLDRVALIVASCITRTLRACNLTRARVKSATSAASAYFAYECVLHIAIYTFDRLAGAEEGRVKWRENGRQRGRGSVTFPPSYLHNFK